ncbi:hypothetical protein HanXRQr2_Chr12g0561561 [Helianthus annuus]|uniref:Uncharacterized protein n=1 Tax=Helianthus annuus TaxID=4232 RepID=A0A9K3HJN3_HELAN|nr:hypothetical protein HanXRQr2_Chr12g0561561 [Helianthus annuus]
MVGVADVLILTSATVAFVGGRAAGRAPAWREMKNGRLDAQAGDEKWTTGCAATWRGLGLHFDP